MKSKLLIIGMVSLAAIVGIVAFIISANQKQGVGFPLDDAWIHQTFARNLVEYSEWSFQVGHPSSGSTAPLWNIILAIGYFFHINKFVWAWLAGGLSLILCGILGIKIAKQFIDINTFWAIAFGIAIVSEWHLIWAALSGMETAIYCAAILLVYYLTASKKLTWLIGLAIGLAIWIRPDAVTLFAPVFMVLVLRDINWKQKAGEIIKVMVVGGVFLVIYFAFNFMMDGKIFPNTLYAKQMEYRVLLETPLMLRFSRLLIVMLTGIGSILLPGHIWGIVTAIRHKHWTWLAFTLWWLGYIAIYAVSLPVVYQHGRYIIPAISVFLVNGMIGWIWLVKDIKKPEWQFRLRTIISLSALGISIVFLGLGAKVYVEDVAIINTEMVATAQWMQENIPEDAVIAVHDIGAVGYFTASRIVDMAGLVTPAIIPIIRDEPALATYLNNENVDYLVTFPGWYPGLTAQLPIAFQTPCSYSCPAGGEAMTIYIWNLSK